MEYEAFVSRDAVDDDEWRVEAIDYASEGECYVAIFSGPSARERAYSSARSKNKG
jgi:hypothetical protein